MTGRHPIHQVEFHRDGWWRAPTQPYHHDLADQIRFEQQGRRYIGNRSDCHIEERVVVRGCRHTPDQIIQSPRCAGGLPRAQVVGGAAVNKSLRVHVAAVPTGAGFLHSSSPSRRRARDRSLVNGLHKRSTNVQLGQSSVHRGKLVIDFVYSIRCVQHHAHFFGNLRAVGAGIRWKVQEKVMVSS